MEEPTAKPLEEVKPMREPQRSPEHCGVPMRRLSSASPLGGLVSVWVCRKECGVQIKEERKP